MPRWVTGFPDVVRVLALGILATLAALASLADARPRHDLLEAAAPANPRAGYQERLPSPSPGLFSTAVQGTTYFGGTGWAPDSLRWEAIEGGTWTFDSGVGSHFDHSAEGVNPYKDPSLHATMEGWVGIDNTYSELPYFRRMTEADFAGESSVCVGSAAGLGGNASLWAGVLTTEAEALCYVSGIGYGNNWFVCVERTFAYDGSGSVSWSFDYVNDTEAAFDYSYAFVDTTGNGDEVEVWKLTGTSSGTTALTLFPGTDLRSDPGTIVLKLCVGSDGAYSDEDGLYTTGCGALAVDDVSVNGGGIAHAAGFEAGNDGWVLSSPQPGAGGDWTNIRSLDDLPPYGGIVCPTTCVLEDSVLVFEDLDVGGHGLYQDNLAASPWIDLRAAGLTGSAGKFVELDYYFTGSYPSYVFVYPVVQWYPYTCASGRVTTSPFRAPGFSCFVNSCYGFSNRCTQPGQPNRISLGTVMDLEAEQVRIGIGVLSFCRFYSDCSGNTDSTPWIDNVRFGVFGAPQAPFLSARTIDHFQDAFPEDGTLGIDAPGRIDQGNLKGVVVPEPRSSLGDTLVVQGGVGGAEVRVVFAVDPGPGIDLGRLNAWLGSHANEGDWLGLEWYSARMDTAQQGGALSVGNWMTAYHEEDPNFSGTDEDLDPTDLNPRGGMTRLANDIFPDDLLTPGSRLLLYYKTRYLSGSDWFFFPDTTGGNHTEMEVLPSSMSADSTFNCLLYVDHFDGRGAQPIIEGALGNLLPGGSGNFEGTAWDRWDVRAPSSAQASFGRPPLAEYGATTMQALGYRTILWNSGNLEHSNLTKEDADVLIPWLTFDGSGSRGLYLSGDGIANGIMDDAGTDPRALTLLNEYLGATFACDPARAANCPSGTVEEPAACLDLDPRIGAPVAGNPARGVQHRAQGNGCPELRSFDVLQVFPGARGGPEGDETYEGPAKGTVEFASVVNEVPGKYRSVVDGVSVHYRRDAGECFYDAPGGLTAIEERLNEVLTYFGVSGQECGIGDVTQLGDAAEPPALAWGVRVLSPNPLRGRDRVELELSLPEQRAVSVRVFDVGGRLVRTVHEGTLPAGAQRLSWDLRNMAGQAVPGGIYFVRGDGESEIVRRVVVLE